MPKANMPKAKTLKLREGKPNLFNLADESGNNLARVEIRYTPEKSVYIRADHLFKEGKELQIIV